MLRERVEPFCVPSSPLVWPSSDLEESFKISGFELLFCFGAGLNPMAANCEAAWVELAFGWRSQAFSRQEALGGRIRSVLFRDPSALRQGVGWRVAAAGGGPGCWNAGLTLLLGVGAVQLD